MADEMRTEEVIFFDSRGEVMRVAKRTTGNF